MTYYTEHHCCETCSYSRDEITTGNGRHWFMCALKQSAVADNQTQGLNDDMLALVDGNARCDEYECDNARFHEAHGFYPDDGMPASPDYGVRAGRLVGVQ